MNIYLTTNELNSFFRQINLEKKVKKINKKDKSPKRQKKNLIVIN